MKCKLHFGNLNKVKLLTLLLVTLGLQAFPQTFFGTSRTPADNAAQQGATATVIPPALMQAGDLVIIYGQHRANGATLSIGTNGGQTWNSGGMYTPAGSTQTIFISWCRFNGTWAANPTVTGGAAATALTAVMYVFRPTNSNNRWGVHLLQTNANGNGFVQTINGVITTLPRTVTMAFWSNAAQNVWGQTGLPPINVGWTKPFTFIAGQVRNTQGGVGSGQSHTSAYNIQANPATLNNTQQTQAIINAITLRSSMTWYEINDEACGAVTLIPGASCVNTPGTLNNATISTGLPTACTTGNLYDVWYQFTATSTSHAIELSNYGSNFTRRQLVVYQGTCLGLTYASCSAVQTSGTSLSHTFTDFSPGTTYYIRVIYQTPAGLGLTTNGGFNICVITNTVTTNPVIQTGKSYTNISRPNGGVIRNGDVLEFRSAISVGGFGAGENAPIYNVTYHDTITSGLSYVANSIRFETNEGLQYQSGITGLVSLTDASGDDEAVQSGGVLRINVASLNREASAASPGTSRQFIREVSPAVTPISYASAGGGKIHPYGRPNQFGGYVIIVVRYQVTVTAANGTTFNTSNGAFRYKTTTSNSDDVTFPQTIINFPRYTVYTSVDTTLCQSSVGINTYSGGDFGTGTTRHDSTQLTIAPGYIWDAFSTTTQPDDGEFAVVNNTSTDGSTNKFGPPSSRIYTVWDIIGDHTNTTNVDSGNLAVAPGTNGGYMAVVNAAYGINTAVQKNITGLCSDTYYEFSAWFKNICSACSSDSSGLGNWAGASFKPYIPIASRVLNDSAGVGPDLTFNIDGQDYYTTGNIPYDKRWVKKGFLFKTGPAQTSVSLTIRNNAPGGGGNDWAIDDIGLATCLPRLTMRPSRNPTYCLNNQVTLSVAVSTFYNNYVYYFWERSTDNGVTWSAIHGTAASPLSYTYSNFSGGEYRDTVALPSFLTTAAMNGYKYRIRTATSITNLSSLTCAVYNTVDVITINVNPSCNVLPVEFLAFTSELKNGFTQLNWAVKDEQNVKQYEVERSTDGINFTFIGMLDAKNTGLYSESYVFHDPVPVNGKLYYRLKVVGAVNTSSKYSNILSVSLIKNNSLEIVNLVNPFESVIRFQLNAFKNEEVKLQLTDALGKPLMNKKIVVNKGANAITFEAPPHLQRGSYLLRVVSASESIYKIIQKN